MFECLPVDQLAYLLSLLDPDVWIILPTKPYVMIVIFTDTGPVEWIWDAPTELYCETWPEY